MHAPRAARDPRRTVRLMFRLYVRSARSWANRIDWGDGDRCGEGDGGGYGCSRGGGGLDTGNGYHPPAIPAVRSDLLCRGGETTRKPPWAGTFTGVLSYHAARGLRC